MKLDARTFITTLPKSLAEMPSPEWLVTLLRIDATTPLKRSEELRAAVRDTLRQGGYKPTGRGKPASEYLVRTAEEGGIRSINLVVDVCNVVSLHSGLPISVVDMARATPPFAIRISPAGTSYVFNAGGQEIDVSGLICLFDEEGPCGNAVKDSQRTKTNDATTKTLSVIWGPEEYETQVDDAFKFYIDLLQRCGATVSEATVQR
ncbi:MAG TPA: phenylalanine--tRNA ligase beta subunit-related protein [Longimicrobiales bacterium]|nr:phenylalanine--tRNA ligase beta subunit-related protein [Longimicrobiales bacterium]